MLTFAELTTLSNVVHHSALEGWNLAEIAAGCGVSLMVKVSGEFQSCSEDWSRKSIQFLSPQRMSACRRR